MSKVLITGHRGFVGRHVTRELQSHELTLIDIQEGKDARDFFRYNDTRYDLVIHLAAVVGGRAMIEGNPLALAVDLSIDA
jgi:nucleoside-diphosphate-sugar epimerase